MITEDQNGRLRELWDWVLAYQPAGKTRRQFWAAFDAQAGDLLQQVWADNADEALRERWVDLLSLADDRGFDGSEGLQDQSMA